MKIFILICNILVPVIMIALGILYKQHLYKKVNKILDLFIPITMIGAGIGYEYKVDSSNSTNKLVSANKKCSLIWIISGIVTLIITVIVLLLNKSNIVNATNFLDTSNISVIILEIELAIATVVFVSVEFVLKKAFYKKIDG